MSDSRLQEIMTRAVVGRGERTLSWCHKLAAGEMKQVLGIRVGKATVAAGGQAGEPLAELTLDCDLWCSDGEATKVMRTRSRCAEEIDVPLRGEVLGEQQSRVELVGGPRSTAVRVEEGSIYIDFEATVAIEVTALARLWVRAFDLAVTGDDRWESSSASGDASHSFGSH